jgi:hypothetical protein
LEALLSGPDGTNPALDRASTAALVSALRALRGQDSAGTNRSITPETHIGFDPPK